MLEIHPGIPERVASVITRTVLTTSPPCVREEYVDETHGATMGFESSISRPYWRVCMFNESIIAVKSSSSDFFSYKVFFDVENNNDHVEILSGFM